MMVERTLSLRSIVRLYRWYQKCPHPECGHSRVAFSELVVECVDSMTNTRVKLSEVLYDHPLKIFVFNEYQCFDLVLSEDFRKYHPGVKCDSCTRSIEDHVVHDRFVSCHHDGKKWNESLLNEHLILEFELPPDFHDLFEC